MAMIFPHSLSSRLTLFYASAFSIFLLLAFGLALLLVRHSMDNEISDDLAEDINVYREIFNKAGAKGVIEEIQRDVKASDASDEFVNLVDTRGEQIYSTMGEDWNGLDINEDIFSRVFQTKTTDEVYFETQAIPEREYETRVAYGRIGPDMIMQIGESLEQTEEMLELLITLFFVSFLAVIPPALISGWLLVKRAVGGIQKVSIAATRIRNGHLDSQVDIIGQSTEIQNLADTFNSMARRIRELITEMREMIDNIAHDLRTPLGRIRMISEMTLSSSKNDECKTAAANTLEQCDKLLKYINATLDVAEVEAGVSSGKIEEVDISAVASDACELFETLADEKNITFTSSLEPDCIVYGNRQNLQRMVANVLDNAFKYTPDDGRVDIRLERTGNNLAITVTDTGMGIPPEEQERVFDRFYRCDQSRGQEGCGLGLSFSRAVARAHHGDITLTSSPGAGSTFIITMPGIK